MDKYTNLKKYNQFLHQFREKFPCSFCDKNILPSEYEKHCIEEKHSINVKINCIWCRGKVSWKNRQKYLNMKHVKECAKIFLKNLYSTNSNSDATFNSPSTSYYNTPSNNIIANTTTTTTTIVPSTSNSSTSDFKHKWKINIMFEDYNAKHFFGVLEKIVQNHPNIIALNFDIDDEEFLFKIPDPPTPTMMQNVLKFRNENINKAVYFFKYFLGKVHELSEAEVNSDLIDLDHVENWYHLMVRRVAFESFLDAMRNFDFGHTRILPFYTWCDGGDFEHFQYRQHVHMIVASRKEGEHFFENVWPKVIPSSKPPGCSRFLCKEHKRITTPLHFINAIQYVSRPQSSCPGNFHQTMAKKTMNNNNNNNNQQKKKNKKISFMTPTQSRHFYITTPLPEIAKFCLALQYDKGIVELLQSMYQNFEPDYDLDGVVQINSRWHIPVKNLPNILLDLTLPIHTDFVLNNNNNTDSSSSNNTNAYLSYPLKDVYFNKTRRRRAQQQQHPPTTEFKFLRMIENFNLPLRPKVQKRLNSVKQSVDRAKRIKEEEIEALVESKNEEIEDLKKKNEARCKRLKSKIKDLKKRNEIRCKNLSESKNAEIEALKRKISHIKKLYQESMEEKFLKSQKHHRSTSTPLEKTNDAEETNFLKKQLDEWKRKIDETIGIQQKSKRHLTTSRDDDDDDDHQRMAKFINYYIQM